MADIDSDRHIQELGQPLGAKVMRSLAPNLVINGVFPIILYWVLTTHGVEHVPALVSGSVFPLAYSLWEWARSRQLDVIAAISLTFIVVSAVASLISGSPRFTLMKESISRPIMFHIAGKFATGDDPARMRVWSERWQYPSFRHSMRVMTVVWGGAFMADALVRTWLVFVLSTSVFLVASQALFYGMFAATFATTVAYGRRAQRRAQAHYPIT